MKDPKRDLDERLAFLDWSEEDRRALAEMAPVFQKHADRIVAAFYRHLLSFGATRQLLLDPAVKDRLLQQQRSYLASLAGPRLDEGYLKERRRIGEVHERIGLEPRFYLGSYALYFSLLTPLICEFHAGDRGRAEHCVSALVKLLSLDSQLAIDAYIERREAQLAFLNEELAAAGRALAREMEEQSSALRQTRQRAQAAEELASVGILAAGLAHEIGTPMGVIRGHAEMLASSVGDQKGRWRLATIVEQIDRISSIMQTLLNLARPHETARTPLEMSAVLESTLTLLSEKFRRRKIDVERHFSRVPSVLGDAEKLQQVFLNLLLNAVDAMPGGGRLGIAIACEGERKVEVRVTDSGVGIPAEILPRVFEAFYTSKEAGSGHGLGLVVARAIVADHGGTIDVESTPGQGTTFRIQLPAVAQPPPTRER